MALDRDPVATLGRRLLDDPQLDCQDAVLEPRDRAFGVDVLGEVHLALERPVLDLHLLVHAARHAWTLPLAADDEQPFARDDADRLWVYARQLDDDGERVRVARVEAVDIRAEPVPHPREARDLPEVREQLLDLFLQLVDVATRHVGERYPREPVSGVGRNRFMTQIFFFSSPKTPRITSF
jgi:hypothetical protein